MHVCMCVRIHSCLYNMCAYHICMCVCMQAQRTGAYASTHGQTFAKSSRHHPLCQWNLSLWPPAFRDHLSSKTTWSRSSSNHIIYLRDHLYTETTFFWPTHGCFTVLWIVGLTWGTPRPILIKTQSYRLRIIVNLWGFVIEGFLRETEARLSQLTFDL